MKISDVLRTISTTLSKPISDIRYKNISEDMVNDQLEDMKWSLSIAQDIFSQLSDEQSLRLYDEVKSELKMNSVIVNAVGKDCTRFILDIDKNLSGKAKALGFFKSMIITTNSLITTLSDLQKHTKEIFGDKKGIMVGDIQMSHGLLLGMINTAMIYVDFMMFIVAIFSHVISKSKRPIIPKYMTDRVATNGDICISLINKIVNSPTGMSVLSIIMNMKRKGTDFKMASGDAIRQNLDQSAAESGTIIFAVLYKALGFLNAIGNYFIDFRHTWYEMMKERKKWLENHVANIKMSLEGMDKNDPAYVKTLGIIAYYEDKIASYDKKLNEYYNE